MASFARYACRDSFPGCAWWTDKVGDWAERVREHVQAAHPTRPELAAMPPGAVQSDVAALDARQDVIAALVLDWRFESGARASIRAPLGAKLTAAEAEAFCEAVRALVETPTQTPGKEGTS